jgi:hypothetical protein
VCRCPHLGPPPPKQNKRGRYPLAISEECWGVGELFTIIIICRFLPKGGSDTRPCTPYQNEGVPSSLLSERGSGGEVTPCTPYQNEGVPPPLLIRTRGLRRGTMTAHSLSERGGAAFAPYQNEGAGARSRRALLIRTRGGRRRSLSERGSGGEAHPGVWRGPG